ncbi:hypothetical protein HanPI659440_Chr03g0099711 [Helianthus annuus]|nr:hypothetical protein HanPI659440_Chr03g0099711 [Helianthus annuus]
MQPWRIYPLCSIVYRSEPHNRFITSTMLVLPMMPVLNPQKWYDCWLVLTYVG